MVAIFVLIINLLHAFMKKSSHFGSQMLWMATQQKTKPNTEIAQVMIIFQIQKPLAANSTNVIVERKLQSWNKNFVWNGRRYFYFIIIVTVSDTSTSGRKYCTSVIQGYFMFLIGRIFFSLFFLSTPTAIYGATKFIFSENYVWAPSGQQTTVTIM